MTKEYLLWLLRLVMLPSNAVEFIFLVDKCCKVTEVEQHYTSVFLLLNDNLLFYLHYMKFSLG